ncbi:DCC1-like thiol-disulfide oxidoreductase family protein [Streptomyces sp. NPDC004647]|uniref:thiol-disulfide oxidoreductase DCC family protein n=1 Tax=Streptomyces sp. NPDC004647 TaxID=3154671 RepID=UPI00339E5B5A
MTASAAGARTDQGADRAPVRRLTVLYDPDCSLCAFVRDWLARQRQLVPLDLMPVGSAEAGRRFPGLDHAAALREITVIGDAGQIYRGSAAWVVCLWALAEYRPMSHRLSTPAGAPFARAAVLAAAKYREARSPARSRGPGAAACADGCAAPGPAPDLAVGYGPGSGPGSNPGPSSGSGSDPGPGSGRAGPRSAPGCD